MTTSSEGAVAAAFEGYELAILGITSSEGLPEEETEFAEWIARGSHGDMGYLETHAGAKYRPRNVLPDCRSLIFTGLSYHQNRGEIPPDHGLVAEYAWGRDYHKVLGKRLRRVAALLRELYPTERFLAFSDSTPLAERSFAARAGVGFIGRNTLLIRRGMGSLFVLGGIATTLGIEAGTSECEKLKGCPSGCTRCIDACPTGALTGPYRIDACRCISYLTIEHKGNIAKELRNLMGAWIFGCDECQSACPFNARVEETFVADFLSPNAGQTLPIEEVLAIESDGEFIRRFAGSPLMRLKRKGLVRNACVAAANLGLQKLSLRLKDLTADDEDIVRRHAAWALDNLQDSSR